MIIKGEVFYIRKIGWIKFGGYILFIYRIEGFIERGFENNVRFEKIFKLSGICFEIEFLGISRYNEGEGG